MLKYLCNECGLDFKSDKDPSNRECPDCGAKAEDHVLMSLTEPEDNLIAIGQRMVCEA